MLKQNSVKTVASSRWSLLLHCEIWKKKKNSDQQYLVGNVFGRNHYIRYRWTRPGQTPIPWHGLLYDSRIFGLVSMREMMLIMNARALPIIVRFYTVIQRLVGTQFLRPMNFKVLWPSSKIKSVFTKYHLFFLRELSTIYWCFHADFRLEVFTYIFWSRSELRIFLFSPFIFTNFEWMIDECSS